MLSRLFNKKNTDFLPPINHGHAIITQHSTTYTVYTTVVQSPTVQIQNSLANRATSIQFGQIPSLPLQELSPLIQNNILPPLGRVSSSNEEQSNVSSPQESSSSSILSSSSTSVQTGSTPIPIQRLPQWVTPDEPGNFEDHRVFIRRSNSVPLPEIPLENSEIVRSTSVIATTALNPRKPLPRIEKTPPRELEGVKRPTPIRSRENQVLMPPDDSWELGLTSGLNGSRSVLGNLGEGTSESPPPII